MPTKPALAMRPVRVTSRPNSLRIGVSRNEMRITSIASNAQPRPEMISSFQWNAFSGTRSSRARKDSAAI